MIEEIQWAELRVSVRKQYAQAVAEFLIQQGSSNGIVEEKSPADKSIAVLKAYIKNDAGCGAYVNSVAQYMTGLFAAARRRELLERIFMHDVRNVLAGLQAWSDQLREETPSETAQNVVRLVEQLVHEVESQSVLLRAELGDLRAHLSPVHINHVMEAVETMFRNHPCSESKELLAQRVTGDRTLTTDESLLVRVLGNMVKNALEASPPGSQVRLWFEKTVGGSAFHVHNPGIIPPSVAAHIFQPHFSSKGRSRGFGTYAMRLIGENCLGGRVSFVSDAVAGTQFSVELP